LLRHHTAVLYKGGTVNRILTLTLASNSAKVGDIVYLDKSNKCTTATPTGTTARVVGLVSKIVNGTTAEVTVVNDPYAETEEPAIWGKDEYELHT
jgi:hypothetical protein